MAIGDDLHALVLKDLDGLTEDGRRAKPELVLDPRRELDVYLSVLAPAVEDAPRLYAAGTGERSWLLLERVAGSPLHEVGELERWAGAARWLARFHREHGGRRAARLLRYGRPLYEAWLARALELNDAGDVAWLADAYPVAIEVLEGIPPVLLHGEFYASNVLVEPSGRVRPVDWETASAGPALLDLAALTAGRWSEVERERLAAAYHEEASGAGGVPGGGFVEQLECCRLHLAVQWLGWSAEWQPPPSQEQFWLAEAARAAERLGL